MKREIINKLTKSFEEAAHVEQGVEYWMARDIQEILEYDKWSNFLSVIEKAKIACQNASINTMYFIPCVVSLRTRRL